MPQTGRESGWPVWLELLFRLLVLARQPLQEPFLCDRIVDLTSADDMSLMMIEACDRQKCRWMYQGVMRRGQHCLQCGMIDWRWVCCVGYVGIYSVQKGALALSALSDPF